MSTESLGLKFERLADLLERVKGALAESGKPLAIIMAGHNGSGKSTLWYQQLAPVLEMPLINADRMMLSILPETTKSTALPTWAQTLRDTDVGWMSVTQNGVKAFIKEAIANKVYFATETVFSHWAPRADGGHDSKIDDIVSYQKSGYFVLLCFVGLSKVELSLARVFTRKQKGGHDVPHAKLVGRFPRTQKAISQAINIADAAILLDNSLEEEIGFRPCRAQLRDNVFYDYRTGGDKDIVIEQWLSIVAPHK